MSLLARNGHHGASRWPLCRVWSEAEIVRRQIRREIASRATVDHSVQAGIHGGEKGHSKFKQTIRDLNDG